MNWFSQIYSGAKWKRYFLSSVLCPSFSTGEKLRAREKKLLFLKCLAPVNGESRLQSQL